MYMFITRTQRVCYLTLKIIITKFTGKWMNVKCVSVEVTQLLLVASLLWGLLPSFQIHTWSLIIFLIIHAWP